MRPVHRRSGSWNVLDHETSDRRGSPFRSRITWTAVLAASVLSSCKPTSGQLTREASSSVASKACAESVGSDPRDIVCRRWACGHAGLTAAAWNGDAKTCAGGQIDEAARERALRLVNTYRFLAGVPEVDSEPAWTAPAQDCALLAHANGKLSHSPPRDWSCWSDRGARASAVSLIANRSAPLAIDPFIEDPGNESTMVHRRWLLSEKIHRIALGSTDRFTCALVDGRELEDETQSVAETSEEPEASEGQALSAAARPWVAWPPAGPVPIDVFRRTRTDAIGWTIQSSSLDLDGASVEVRVDGERRAVKVAPLERTLGSLTAIRFVPVGWSTEPGRRYDVHAVKDDIVIDVGVEPVECP